MLRKRTRSVQKDQQMGQITSDACLESFLQSDFVGQKQKTSSFFTLPGLFVGLSPNKGTLDCDSLRSPTSPLDFKLFRSLKPSQNGTQKCWDCQKVGLSIVDSLADDDFDEKPDGNLNFISSSNSKSILFGPQIRTKVSNSRTHIENPTDLQKGSSDVLFEIGEDPFGPDPFGPDPFGKIQSFSLDSKRSGFDVYRLGGFKPKLRAEGSCLRNEMFSTELKNVLSSRAVPVASSDGFSGSLSASEIELSEDYTCVISHGPNPKTTHIFGDRILECHPNETDSGNKKGESLEVGRGTVVASPCDDFLSFCHFCKKRLEEGKDIYMYRGEKAFCSADCRNEEILIEEQKEKSIINEAPMESLDSKNGDENFEQCMFTIT